MKSGVTKNCSSNTKNLPNMNKQTKDQNKTQQKKKKITEPKKVRRHNIPVDTVAETISFVIKGQLTPIKQTPITLEKVTKTSILVDKSSEKCNPVITQNIGAKTPTKVQIKTAKSASKDSPTKGLSKDETKVADKKHVFQSNSNISNAQKVIEDVSRENYEVVVKTIQKCDLDDHKLVKNKTEPRPKQAERCSKKDSRDNSKSKVDGKAKTNQTDLRSKSAEKLQNKTKVSNECKKLELPKKKIVKSNLNKEKLFRKAKLIKRTIGISSNLKQVLQRKVKTNKDDLKPGKIRSNKKISTKVGEKNSSKVEIKNENVDFSESKSESEQRKSKEITLKEMTDKKLKKVKLNPIAKRKILTLTSKKILVRKKLLSKKERMKSKEERRKEKLYKFWNAPKRHRVASLNAIAKVHCLYENESKALFDKIAEEGMIRKVIKQEVIEKESEKKSRDNEESDSESEEEEPCTRILRYVPGLRGAGKHWDPNPLSSDENSSDVESVRSTPVKRVRVKKEPKEESDKEIKKKRGPAKGQKRARRPKSPLTMDLKDMVVSKRMASLNASAMLSASYSNERKTKFSKNEDTDTDDSSADEYFAALDQLEPLRKTKLIEEIKVEKIDKEEDKKLIEVHTTPNKKVAVILNQDTDVTITGVYVNSTTRSTHHEGYCSIAGMQYRISATSHTQTAATAVATETVLQGTNGTQENQTNEPQRSCSSQSYTPLDALTNMQPPPGPGIHQQGPPPSGHHVMPPMAPPPPHQITSPQLRHQAPPSGCSSSAFSSPHHGTSCPSASGAGGHHAVPPAGPPAGPPMAPHSSGEPPAGYHHGYYQPAGPLITSPYGHSHAQPPLVQQGPPQPPLSKSASLSDTTSTTPSSATSPMVPPTQVPPQPPSSNGGDSDNEVIITSVTAGTKEIPPSSHSTPISYRAYSHYPPPASDMRYSYSYPAYHYPTPPPPSPNPYPPPHPHSDLCYPTPMAYHPKYGTSYRRYLTTSSQYYQAPPGAGAPEMYTTQSAPAPGLPSQAQPSQQVVTASPASSNPQYASVMTGPPPPPTIMEPYPPPPAPPTLVETTYQHPPPHHYYPPTYGIPPQCYSHPPGRSIPYAHTYQPCPCPMQSCSKNGLAGPLTGDSKRSNISKNSIPLPPVASLALPLEPASATGPPSPARGSAGMPPPPSPAGAVYQATPPAPKQESRSPEAQECGQEKKRKARVGKAMVRSNMQQNTMLLMCNPSQNCDVKREIESPKEKTELHKKETLLAAEVIPPKMPDPILDKTCLDESCALFKNEVKDDRNIDPLKSDKIVTDITSEKVAEDVNKNVDISKNLECNEKETTAIPEATKQNLPLITEEEPLPPCIKTVAENVKVKNMKRKQSMEAAAKEKTNVPDNNNSPPSKKRRKLNSYKNIIKKKTNCVKINNGRSRLLKPSKGLKTKLSPVKRKLNVSKEQTNNKRMKLCKNPQKKVLRYKHTIKNNNNNNIKSANNGSKTAEKALDNLIAKNNVDKIIDAVIKTIGYAKQECTVTKIIKNPDYKSIMEEKCAAKVKNPECNTVCKTTGSAKRKSSATRCKEAFKADMVPKVPRRSLQGPKWSNGWCWEGEPFEAKVFINSDDVTCIRKCYPMMRHDSGDILAPRDCVLLAGPKKNDLPFVAKIAFLWENADDGEMMMSLLWYYRPEHTDQGRMPCDQPDEVFASKHKDSNSVACIDDKCYVLTFNEYCRYRRNFRRVEEGIEKKSPRMPETEPYPRTSRQPPSSVSAENIFFCRKVYDYRQKRMIKNPT